MRRSSGWSPALSSRTFTVELPHKDVRLRTHFRRRIMWFLSLLLERAFFKPYVCRPVQ